MNKPNPKPAQPGKTPPTQQPSQPKQPKIPLRETPIKQPFRETPSPKNPERKGDPTRL